MLIFRCMCGYCDLELVWKPDECRCCIDYDRCFEKMEASNVRGNALQRTWHSKMFALTDGFLMWQGLVSKKGIRVPTIQGDKMLLIMSKFIYILILLGQQQNNNQLFSKDNCGKCINCCTTLQDTLGLLLIVNLFDLYGNILELAREYHYHAVSTIVFEKNTRMLTKNTLAMKKKKKEKKKTREEKKEGKEKKEAIRVEVSKMNNMHE